MKLFNIFKKKKYKDEDNFKRASREELGLLPEEEDLDEDLEDEEPESAPVVTKKPLRRYRLVGGLIGAIAGMYLFRHKTRHLKFTVGLPLILLLQLAGILLFYRIL